jgi:hypothetical protein
MNDCPTKLECTSDTMEAEQQAMNIASFKPFAVHELMHHAIRSWQGKVKHRREI